jgi:hypothetical protein
MTDSDSSRFDAQLRGWRTLTALHPLSIDLARIALIREKAAAELSRAEVIERMLLELGLNDEALEEFPEALRPHCGQGLRVWQYPAQFGKYLARLASLEVRSYVELGVRHGGSFVVTVELLERFRRLDYAVAVDIIACPGVAEYAAINPRIEFCRVNTQGAEFVPLLRRLQPIDLVFIDSHHEEGQCRREVAAVCEVANMIALHDISNVGCPGVATVWEEIKASRDYVCFEYTDQYTGMGPYMGIGLAVKNERLARRRLPESVPSLR